MTKLYRIIDVPLCLRRSESRALQNLSRNNFSELHPRDILFFGSILLFFIALERCRLAKNL